MYTADELAKQLVDSRARFLVTVPPFLDKAQEAAKKSGIEEVFVFGTAEGAAPFSDLPLDLGEVWAVPARNIVAAESASGREGSPPRRSSRFR